jgi:uncharacterized protein
MPGRIIFVTILLAVITFLSVSKISAQTQEQIGASDAFIRAFLVKDWTTLYRHSSPALLKQLDSTKFAMINDQIRENYGRVLSRWLYQTESTNGYLTAKWNTLFERDSVSLHIVVDSAALVAGIWLKDVAGRYAFNHPSYADTALFKEYNTNFGEPDTRLPATLALPKGPGPFPVVVFVHGSGPHDQDETLYGNKPFRDIAWGLASNGIATFRYVKRTKAYPKSFDVTKHSVEEEVIIDALEALNIADSKQEIDGSRIFLLGHSLGAMLAPEIASRSKVVRGAILLAAPARDLVTVALDQLEFLRTKDAASTEEDKLALERGLTIGKRVLSGTAGKSEVFLGVPADYFYKLNAYQQVATARELDIPLFIGQGEKDYQVSNIDFDLWKYELASKSNVSFNLYPDCYHLFIKTDEAPSKTNYETEGHVTKLLIDDLVQWIKAIQ